MMSFPELPSVLKVSLARRVPRYDPDLSRSSRIEGLEAYLLTAAHAQGDLHAERVDWEKSLWEVEQRWARVSGWEPIVRTRTEKAVTEAKAKVAPDLYAELRGTQWIIKLLTQEIERMDRDQTTVSRAYTLETGG